MAQDVISPGTTIPEIKSVRGQIALSVPPLGTESIHLARATRGLDGQFLLTPLQSAAKYSARCYIQGHSPGLLSQICLQGNNSVHKPGHASGAQNSQLCAGEAVLPLFSQSLPCHCALYKSVNNLSEVQNTSIYPSILSQATAAADCFQGKSIRARKVQHTNSPSETSKQSLALGFPKLDAVFAALSLMALMDLSAGNVSHCFLNHLYFWYSQCLAAPCFTKYMLHQKVFLIAGLLGNEEIHLTMAPSTDHSRFDRAQSVIFLPH